jgi:hypothetical protein
VQPQHLLPEREGLREPLEVLLRGMLPLDMGSYLWRPCRRSCI